MMILTFIPYKQSRLYDLPNESGEYLIEGACFIWLMMHFFNSEQYKNISGSCQVCDTKSSLLTIYLKD